MYLLLHVPSDLPPAHFEAPHPVLTEAERRAAAAALGGSPAIEVTHGTSHLYRPVSHIGRPLEARCSSSHFCILAPGWQPLPAVFELLKRAADSVRESGGAPALPLLRVRLLRGPRTCHLVAVEAGSTAHAQALTSTLSAAPVGESLLAVFPLETGDLRRRPVCWADDVSSMDFSRPPDAPDTPVTHDIPVVSALVVPPLSVRNYAELPTCPQCMERLDSSVSGVRHMLCVHEADCSCHLIEAPRVCPTCRAWRATMADCGVADAAAGAAETASPLPQGPESPAAAGAPAQGAASAAAAAGSAAVAAAAAGGAGAERGRPAGLLMLRASASAERLECATALMNAAAGARLPVCRVCRRADSLWGCMICGFVGCGRYTGQHTMKHCHATGHSFVIELTSQWIWDYNGDIFVHRLLIHRGVRSVLPGGEVEGEPRPVAKARVDVRYENKHEDLLNEFSHLLRQQMESGRRLHAENLAALEAQHRADPGELRRAAALAARRDAACAAARAAAAGREQAARRVADATARIKAAEAGLREAEGQRKELEAEQSGLKARMAELLRRAQQHKQEDEGALEELRQQVHDLETAVDMRRRCRHLDQAALSGSVTLLAGPAGGARGRGGGRKRK
eukprot:TRINITY_DN34953_c0_g2_i1.p1 TRINITY_DN34953_c0_g2~~TRINITY_DN34953_c0_g2_i1.p1  ORF type:complete len:649 (+),score=217.66 TRINITY_DN34953_c0_g2_i1:76-1947(+)